MERKKLGAYFRYINVHVAWDHLRGKTEFNIWTNTWKEIVGNIMYENTWLAIYDDLKKRYGQS